MKHRARKRFGQHFLQPVWSERVVASIGTRPDDVLIEIGPGQGAITRPLLPRCRHVVAFEIDRDLAAALNAEDHPNLTVITGDVLETTADDLRVRLTALGLDTARLRIAGNLPYNVASPILFHCLDFYAAGLPIGDATVMLQREVADRLLAPPGSRDYGVLSILVQHAATVRRLFDLPPGAFRPMPEVHSTLVRLEPHPPEPRPRDLGTFRSVVRAVFTRRRKTLANALLAWPGTLPPDLSEWLTSLGLDPGQRPEGLDIAAFVHLADALDAPGRTDEEGRAEFGRQHVKR